MACITAAWFSAHLTAPVPPGTARGLGGVADQAHANLGEVTLDRREQHQERVLLGWGRREVGLVCEHERAHVERREARRRVGRVRADELDDRCAQLVAGRRRDAHALAGPCEPCQVIVEPKEGQCTVRLDVGLGALEHRLVVVHPAGAWRQGQVRAVLERARAQ